MATVAEAAGTPAGAAMGSEAGASMDHAGQIHIGPAGAPPAMGHTATRDMAMGTTCRGRQAVRPTHSGDSARIESSTLTQAGTVLGTIAYMSPEQFTEQRVDVQSNIISAGIAAYQLLAGGKPFTGTAATIMHRRLNNIPDRRPVVKHCLRALVQNRPLDRLARVLVTMPSNPEGIRRYCRT